MNRRLFATPGGPLPIRLEGARRLELDGWIAGASRGAEIGVWEGKHAAALLELNPALELLLVDPYAPQPGYRERKNDAAYLDAARRNAEARLARFTGHTFLRAPSVLAAASVRDQSLDFVFIDADHSYRGAMADLIAWSPKVRPGGLICGHDFGTNPGRFIDVERAVRDYTAAAGIDPWFVTDDEQDGSFPCFVWPA